MSTQDENLFFAGHWHLEVRGRALGHCLPDKDAGELVLLVGCHICGADQWHHLFDADTLSDESLQAPRCTEHFAVLDGSCHQFKHWEQPYHHWQSPKCSHRINQSRNGFLDFHEGYALAGAVGSLSEHGGPLVLLSKVSCLWESRSARDSWCRGRSPWDKSLPSSNLCSGCGWSGACYDCRMDVAWRQRVREVRFGFDGIWIYKYGELHDGVLQGCHCALCTFKSTPPRVCPTNSENLNLRGMFRHTRTTIKANQPAFYAIETVRCNPDVCLWKGCLVRKVYAGKPVITVCEAGARILNLHV